MPTKRSTRRPSITLRELSIPNRLDFVFGWQPPETERDRARSPRWTTYHDFLTDYTAVRVNFLAKPGHADAFAERLFSRVAADPRADVEAIGAALFDEQYVDVDDDEPAADELKEGH